MNAKHTDESFEAKGRYTYGESESGRWVDTNADEPDGHYTDTQRASGKRVDTNAGEPDGDGTDTDTDTDTPFANEARDDADAGEGSEEAGQYTDSDLGHGQTHDRNDGERDGEYTDSELRGPRKDQH